MAIIIADSVSYAHVAAAIAAASSGDTVQVPDGSATWDTTLSIAKGIQLVGAGIGSTVITNGVAGSSDLLRYDPSDYPANWPFRLSGFDFDANGKFILVLGVSNKSAPFIKQTGVRVDHNKFANGGGDVGGQAIWNFGTLYGVIDNNVFDGINYPISNNSGLGGSNDTWWANAPQNVFAHGSADYLFYEDNQFINMTGYGGGGDNVIMNGCGGMRFVFRYNTVENGADSYSLLELHGQQEEMIACFGAELYGNQITCGANELTLFKQRSGQSLVFLNNATTSTSPDSTAYTGGIDVCPANYAALKVTHNSYWWGSRKNLTGTLFASVGAGGLDCAGLEGIPALGRDVFSDDSTPGVSSGPLASIPETCAVGQGYWATDQNTSNLTGMVGVNPITPISGVLYRCLSTNVWTAYYTPYTYPHPLRGEGGATKLVMVLK